MPGDTSAPATDGSSKKAICANERAFPGFVTGKCFTFMISWTESIWPEIYAFDLHESKDDVLAAGSPVGWSRVPHRRSSRQQRTEDADPYFYVVVELPNGPTLKAVSTHTFSDGNIRLGARGTG